MVVLFWLDLWEIFFLATLRFELGHLWIFSPALYHCAMATSGFYLWQFQVFKSSAERLMVVLYLIGPVRNFLFGQTEVWTRDLWIYSPALYHCAIVTSGFYLWQFQVFTSSAERLVVILYLIRTVRDFLFGPNSGVWTRDLWIYSTALYHCAIATSGFHLWQFQVFKSGAEGLMVVLFWLDLWEIFFLAITRVWTVSPLDL